VMVARRTSPMVPRFTSPVRISSSATRRAMLLGMAKPMPWSPPLCE